MGVGMGMGMGMRTGMGGTPLQLKRRVHVRVIIGAKNCTTVKTKMKIACHMRLYTKFEGLIGDVRLTDTVENKYSKDLYCKVLFLLMFYLFEQASLSISV